METKNIELKQIVLSKSNPRKSFHKESLEELKNSILKQGVIQPITVRLNLIFSFGINPKSKGLFIFFSIKILKKKALMTSPFSCSKSYRFLSLFS